MSERKIKANEICRDCAGTGRFSAATPRVQELARDFVQWKDKAKVKALMDADICPTCEGAGVY